MKTKFIILLTVFVSGLFLSCSRKTQSSLQQQRSEDIAELMALPLGERINHFAFDLMRQLPDDENLVFSPFSISTALAMTYGGARGQTALEMANTLYFYPDQDSFHHEYSQYLTALESKADEKVQLNIANALWVHQDYHFLPDFFELIRSHYRNELRQVNFRGDREIIRSNINNWVYDQTREKISDLIAPGVLTDDTRLVLVNAIHFLARWMIEFDENFTRKELFHALDGREQQTDFMHRTGYYQYAANAGLQAIELPYAGGNFSMVVVLPGQGTDIRETQESFNAAALNDMLNNLQRTHVELRLPRFEMETSIDLEKELAIMGMPEAFSNRADFSGMTGDDSLMIDKVIHKAMIDVKESGTEAAAATAVVMIMKTSIETDPENTVKFHADRPFMFFIKENTTNGILFMGRMVKL